MSAPTRFMSSGVFARALSANAKPAAPTSVMNSRRRIGLPNRLSQIGFPKKTVLAF
jgi:hypothetical protein